MLVPEINRRNKGDKEYKVALMYVPTSSPQAVHNWMGYRFPNQQRIKAICCGPSKANGCPVGSRTVSPCAHGAFALFAGSCMAFNPLLFKTTHKSGNYLDPGFGLPIDYVNDLMIDYFG